VSLPALGHAGSLHRRSEAVASNLPLAKNAIIACQNISSDFGAIDDTTKDSFHPEKWLTYTTVPSVQRNPRLPPIRPQRIPILS